jgi:deoxyribonuclease V
LVKIPNGFDIAKARQQQSRLAKAVKLKGPPLKNIKLVGGVDVSYRGDQAKGAATILHYDNLAILETQTLKTEISFPYIPTLLSFREAPVISKIFKKLKHQPDVLLVEGHGVAHPYGLGLASHVGVTLNISTVGVAKKLLCGKVEGFTNGRAPIHFKEKLVGYAITPQRGRNPIYVSVGNLIDLDTAVEITLHCMDLHRLPKPLRISHQLAKV